MATKIFMAIASSMFFIASWGFGTFRKIRKNRQGLVGIIGILVILIIGVACSDGEAVYEPDVGSTSQSGGSSGQVLSSVDKQSPEEPASFSSAGRSGYTGGAVFDSGGGVSGSSHAIRHYVAIRYTHDVRQHNQIGNSMTLWATSRFYTSL